MLQLLISSTGVIVSTFSFVKSMCCAETSGAWHPDQLLYKHKPFWCMQQVRVCDGAGYDMDYTLIHYDVNAWEGKAFHYMLQNLQSMGCPTEGLCFDPSFVTRGLIVDQQRGNLLKVDRFG